MVSGSRETAGHGGKWARARTPVVAPVVAPGGGREAGRCGPWASGWPAEVVPGRFPSALEMACRQRWGGTPRSPAARGAALPSDVTQLTPGTDRRAWTVQRRRSVSLVTVPGAAGVAAQSSLLSADGRGFAGM